MKKRIKKFIVVDFDNIPGLTDWPQNLPLPKIDDRVLIDHKEGYVLSVTHNWSGSIYECKIRVGKERNKLKEYRQKIRNDMASFYIKNPDKEDEIWNNTIEQMIALV